jgi:hypothetical protein
MAAIRFCGASVMSFGSSIGWNGQPSSFKCELVEDRKAGDVFVPPPTGTPIYFRFFGFNFFGLLQNWRKSNSTQGLPVFEVSGISPVEVLAGTQVVTGGYAGATGIVSNVINPFGYWESTGYGNAASDQTGMPWALVLSGINAIVNGNISAYGGTIKWRGIQYGIDLSRIPRPPAYYRINTPSVGLLELVSQICDDCGYEWFVELVPGALRPTIRFRTQSRRLQPPLGTIFRYTNTNYGNVMSSASGLESRGDGITSSFLVGANIQYLSETSNMTQFWGYDTLNRPILSTRERQLLPYPASVEIPNVEPLPNPLPRLPAASFMSYWTEYPISLPNNIQSITFNGLTTVTSRTPHGLVTGDYVYIASVNLRGRTNRINDRWQIRRISSTVFSLNQSDDLIAVLLNGGAPVAVTSGGWVRTFETVPTFLAADLNASAIADVIGATYYHVNEYELRCALASEETWVTYISNFRSWSFLTNLRYGGGAYQMDIGSKLGITSAYAAANRLFAQMFQNGGGAGIGGGLFNVNVIPRPQMPGDVLDDRPDNIRREAVAQLSDETIRRKKVYEFVKFHAQEYYGKRFWVGVPFVLTKVDPFTAKIQHSQEVCDGGWVEEDAAPLGLLPINHDFFRTPDGKFGPIMRWSGLPGSDLSTFDASNTITQGTELYLKAQPNPQIVNIPWPAIVMTVSRAVYEESPTGVGSLALLSGLFNVDPAGMRNLARGISNGRLPIKIHPAPRWPIAAGVPMKNNLLSYGPWYLAGPPGRSRYEQNDFAPWSFGSVGAMNQAALAKITDSITFMQEGETGEIRLVGAPTISLGDVLQSGGPNLSGIDIEYGKNGINTTYKFRTFSSGFGSLNRQTAEYVRRLGQSSYEMRRAMRASINTTLFQQERDFSAARSQNAWMQLNRPRRAAQFTPHDAIGAQIVDDEYFNIEGASRVTAATATIDEALMDIQPGYEDRTAITSLTSLLRPLCTGENMNPYMSCYIKPKDIWTNTTINSDTADPFKGHNDIEYMTYGSSDFEGVAQFRNAPAKEVNKVIGLRGPMVITGWGWDIEGYPVPNAGTKTVNFVENYLLKSQLWPAGPTDLLYHHKKGIWTCHDLMLGKATSVIPAGGQGTMEVYGPDGSGTGWEIDVYNWFGSSISGDDVKLQVGYFADANKWYVISADCVEPTPIPETDVYAYITTSNIALTNSAWTKIIFNTENTDANSEYNPTTGLFTPEEHGKYEISVGLSTDVPTARKILAIWTDGVSELQRIADGIDTPHGTVTVKLVAATDYSIQVWTDTSSVEVLAGQSLSYLYIRKMV